MARVLIIGAGIQGLLTALFLADQGQHDICIIDKAVPGAGASGRSGALLRSNYDNAAEVALAERGLRFYGEFPERVGGTGLMRVGLLVTISEPGAAKARHLAQQQRSWGAGIDSVDTQTARSLLPHLRTEDCGLILHQPDAGYCEPNDILSGLVRHLKARGVRFILDSTVRNIALQGGRVVGVQTDDGNLGADAIVVAAGIDAAALIAPWCSVALVPQLTRVAVFRPHEFGNDGFATLIDTIHQAWFRPVAGGAILVGSETGVRSGVDPTAIPLTAPEALVGTYREILAARFAVSAQAAPRGAWAGAFMLSPDARPIVGAVPGVEGLFVMTGDSGGAFKTAPALAEGMAAMVLGVRPPLPQIAALSLDRFTSAQPVEPSLLTISR